jgi:Predicted dehydrogenases and related proteins
MLKRGRRGFLKDLAMMGAGVAAGSQLTGCRTFFAPGAKGSAIMGAHYAPLDKVRIGIIGVGARGGGAVHRLINVPGAEIVAISDLYSDRAENHAKWLQSKGRPMPKLYAGTPDAWKGLCDSDEVNLVYITTPWKLHTPMALYAMRAGKHAVSEVPIAVTIDECWELVETAEKEQRHCMMLENCCYGESEMFALMLCRNGVLGELVHGEGAYLHNLADYKMSRTGYQGMWRLEFSKEHDGNPYPTHGLGPICQYMNINRGDKMDYLVSVSSGQFGLTEFARDHFGAEDERTRWEYKLGDQNTTVIRTNRGRTIMVQHNTTNERPYSRINLIQGTKGILSDYPLRVALAPNSHSWMKDEDLAQLMKKYCHPLWDKSGEMAKKVGGHGGMDFLMDLRLCHCLTNGLPLDIDVYDSVLWSSLVPLTERSVLKRGQSVDVPDFTRGAWRTAKPLGIVGV